MKFRVVIIPGGRGQDKGSGQAGLHSEEERPSPELVTYTPERVVGRFTGVHLIFTV